MIRVSLREPPPIYPRGVGAAADYGRFGFSAWLQ